MVIDTAPSAKGKLLWGICEESESLAGIWHSTAEIRCMRPDSIWHQRHLLK